MSHWNHRVVKETLDDGSDWFSIRDDDESVKYDSIEEFLEGLDD